MATVALTMDDAVAIVKTLIAKPLDLEILSDEGFKDALRVAAARHSQKYPKKNVTKVTGTGQKFVLLTYHGGDTPTGILGWDDDKSKIENVEYPAVVVTETTEPTFLDADHDWDTFKDENGDTYLMLKGFEADEDLRLYWTSPRLFATVDSVEQISVPEQDKLPLMWLATAYAADPYSAHFARSLAADSFNIGVIDWSRVSRELKDIADKYKRHYDEYVASGGGEPYVIIDTDRRWPVMGYLHHMARSR